MTVPSASINGFVATGTGGGCMALIKRLRGYEVIVTSIAEPSIPLLDEAAQVTISHQAGSISFSLPAGALKQFLESVQE